MAFGFTPKFEQSVDLYGFDPTHYLAIALDVVNQFGWSVNYTSKSGLIAFTGTSIFSTSEKITVLIKDNTVNITSENAGSGMYDWGRNKKNVENFITEFDAACARLSAEQIEIMATGLKPQIETDEEDRLALPPPTAADNFKSFFSLFIPRPGYTISPIIVDLNILVFIVMAISGVSLIEPDSQDLLNWGANLRGATLSGQWWRLFTNTFIHIGFLHLLLNMYALLYIGVLLEPYLGKLKFATAYLFTGIIASLTSCYWHPVTISAGASGAIFGMYGVFLAMLTTNFIPKALRKPLLTSIGVFVAFNLMNGVKAGIDNAAHIGGLISGLAIGYIYYPSLKKPLLHGLSYLTIGIVSVLFLITSITIYKQIPDDMVRYNAKIKEFSSLEEDALQIFKLPKNTTQPKLITYVDNGITDWNKNLVLLKEIEKLDLPTDFLVRNDALKKYCKLRIKSYGFIRQAVVENNNSYTDSIKYYNQQIEALLTDMKNK